jgi:starch synthase
MPSVYEPCGLNQLYSLRYGTVPIVHRTGGLADTVTQSTGFPFAHHDEAGLRWAVEAALAAYRDPAKWSRLVQNGMSQDFSWEAQGKLYELLYARLSSLGRH